MRAVLAIVAGILIAAPARAGFYPGYIRKHYPKDIQPLLLKESDLDDACRNGGAATEAQLEATQRQCRRRTQVLYQIQRHGWCWGPDGAIEADKTFMRCGRRATPYSGR